MRFCTKHLSRFYHLGHKGPEDSLSPVSGSCNLLSGDRDLEIFACPRAVPIKSLAGKKHLQLGSGSVEGQNLAQRAKGTLRLFDGARRISNQSKRTKGTTGIPSAVRSESQG